MATVQELLQAAAPNRVRLARCASVEQALRELVADAQLPADGRVVACLWRRLPLLPEILRQTLDRLAETALALWPRWYGQVCTAQAAAEPDLALIAAEVARTVSLPWYRAAAASCRAGLPPRLEQFPPAIEAAQLASAIEPQRMLLVLALTDAQTAPDRLLGLSRAAEWFAAQTHAPVLLLVPAALPESEALANVDFASLTLGRESPPVREAAEEKQNLLVWPLLGVPHPNSPGEQLLASRLCRDAELGPLFCFNQRITTLPGSSYIADLLWEEGKLVVEIDGYRWHSSPDSFRSDRQRDYELLISGYLSLRLPHDEVVASVEDAVQKIRHLVAFRRQHLTPRRSLENRHA